jgi:hypothetical protein
MPFMRDQEILRPLVERLVRLAARPEEASKKELWARHNALLPTPKIPVSLTFEGIPDSQWDLMFGRNHLACRGELARYIEFYLKQRIWMAENVPDDHVFWPAVAIPAIPTPQHQSWGVELLWQTPSDELGAKRVLAPFAEEIDLSRLCIPRTDVDEAATTARLAEASELIGGQLKVYPVFPALGESPFEFAVRMRGLEHIFLDLYDRPQLVHAMMEFITCSMIADHKRREKLGWINCPVDPSGQYQMVSTWRHIAAWLPRDFSARQPAVSDEWAYVSAQSASGLGPAMYEAFVHRYNCQIAEHFTAGTVYYHGCECLDHKLDIIATLPNLRRQHVSAWSSVALAAEKYQGSVVLEVTTHPNLIALGASREEMKREMEKLVSAADGHPINLSITDVLNLGDNPQHLRWWAEAAQEVAS